MSRRFRSTVGLGHVEQQQNKINIEAEIIADKELRRDTDAIIPLVQKMDIETRLKMADNDKNGISFMATPSEIADALLKAKGYEV